MSLFGASLLHVDVDAPAAVGVVVVVEDIVTCRVRVLCAAITQKRFSVSARKGENQAK